jgi:glycolate oxidase FAD binding subunit
MAELTQTLEGIVGAEQVRTGEGARAYIVDDVVPRVVAFPGCVEEVSAVLRVSHEARVGVVPWGGGVHMGLGAMPEKADVVLGLGRLNRVLDHEPGDMTSTVQAGMVFRDYQAALGTQDQFLSLDPGQADRATIGGILAVNASGPRRLRYGTARDLLIGVRVVHADGTVTKGGAKVVKNVTGYDMNKLYIGSLGTLGVIVEATVRLYPVPACERTWVAPFPTPAKAQAAIATILDSPIVPSAIELLSHTAAVGLRQTPGWEPKPGGALLAVAVASVPEAVDAQIRAVQTLGAAACAGDGLCLDGPAHEQFWRSVCDFSLGDSRAVVLKASVLITRVADAVEYGERVAAEHGLRMAAISEAGTGIVRYHFTADDGEGDRTSRFSNVVGALRDFVAEAKGSVVVLQAPPEVKAGLDVWGPPGKDLMLMRGLKKQYDPERILNPGRFVGRL